MLFSSILERYRKKREKHLIVRELILGLKIDERQRKLFLESLEILDDEWMKLLYERLLKFVDSMDQKEITMWMQSGQKNMASARQKEQEERQKDARSFNILLDNI